MIRSEAKRAARERAAQLMGVFTSAGAQPVEADLLLPAETLLDLYGEDIRARAYVTSDPLRGEMMLRPDFTVPVVQMHMAGGAEPARYTYAGEVFRRQETDLTRPNEYLQVGLELFGGDPAEADAEVFALIAEALAPLRLRAVIGDIGILMAAVQGLSTSEDRRQALLRHIWRPRRFRAMLERFGGHGMRRRPPLPDPDTLEEPVGKRTAREVAERLEAIRRDAETPPIAAHEVALIDSLLGLRETAPNVLAALRDIAVDLPMISTAVDRLAARLDALVARGIDVEGLAFEGSYGRTSMEYYDGFVFGFSSQDRPDLAPVATGGRYDALTRVLGQGREIPAVGGVIRPGLLARMGDAP
ncbi:ATP phosphoribosyltransferase regulatory subunit [Oceanicola granulosus HTCC2516]|uniref:Histidine--tRNA ligase n=1 Tax=Oceanicola granulosus (strain ATCC BAA-861 / DSM 15982 / KCTC 12143 / HTCC2516) TaxID=314256 RepID=Q2CAN8_OCEGH|nr:ATP phosphoribosyltransferase regulatory subunit [Oceanicola granulosus]EAR49756.1 ATP phosphoribosyltransferase regulatory subunit [Oceanicola granulosus HTCC2516]